MKLAKDPPIAATGVSTHHSITNSIYIFAKKRTESRLFPYEEGLLKYCFFLTKAPAGWQAV